MTNIRIQGTENKINSFSQIKIMLCHSAADVLQKTNIHDT
jgi:hypothetical protein